MSTPDRDDAPFDAADPTRPQKAPTPKDAATLLLVRKERDGFHVLMGQRAKGHVFMPDKWVFPGGRVDPGDARAFAATELTAATEEKLRLEKTRRPPRAFALCAVRETFEEAGLIVGRAGASSAKAPPGWEDYAKADAAPELHHLRFIARAITPPYRPRRFDARFFLAFAPDVLLSFDRVGADDELLHIKWFSFEEAGRLDLPNVTRFVLGEAQAILAGKCEGGPPFLRWSRSGHRMDRL
jgi:8-oxo-dGTP pyrophosphatase MutT (NUDIX family)